jgi:hypothetical protein
VLEEPFLLLVELLPELLLRVVPDLPFRVDPDLPFLLVDLLPVELVRLPRVLEERVDCAIFVPLLASCQLRLSHRRFECTTRFVMI